MRSVNFLLTHLLTYLLSLKITMVGALAVACTTNTSVSQENLHRCDVVHKHNLDCINGAVFGTTCI